MKEIDGTKWPSSSVYADWSWRVWEPWPRRWCRSASASRRSFSTSFPWSPACQAWREPLWRRNLRPTPMGWTWWDPWVSSQRTPGRTPWSEDAKGRGRFCNIAGSLCQTLSREEERGSWERAETASWASLLKLLLLKPEGKDRQVVCEPTAHSFDSGHGVAVTVSYSRQIRCRHRVRPPWRLTNIIQELMARWSWGTSLQLMSSQACLPTLEEANIVSPCILLHVLSQFC